MNEEFKFSRDRYSAYFYRVIHLYAKRETLRFVPCRNVCQNFTFLSKENELRTRKQFMSGNQQLNHYFSFHSWDLIISDVCSANSPAQDSLAHRMSYVKTSNL